MKRKLLLAALCVVSALGFKANAQEAGTYYIQNVGTGKWLGPGNNWGTQASVLNHADYWKLAKISDGVYTLESVVSNGGTSYYLTGTYCDGGATNFTFTAVAGKENTYNIANGDGGLLTTNGTTVDVSGTDASAAASQWKLWSEADMTAGMAAATVESPFDATYLIKDHDLGRNNRDYSSWNNTGATNPKSSTDAQGATVYSIEAYKKVFDVNQTLSSVPNGVYAVRVNGFYRQDGADANLPYVYANDSKTTLPVRTGSENNMQDAAVSFVAGNYLSEPAYVQVTDGSLKVGVATEGTSCWSIFKNFHLAYYGDHTVAEVLLADYVKAYNEALAEAQAFTETSMFDAAWSDLQDAISDNTLDLNNVTQQQLEDATTNLKAANAAATVAVKRKTVYDSAVALINGGSNVDLTSVVENASFEDGNLNGWTSVNGGAPANNNNWSKVGTYYVERWTQNTNNTQQHLSDGTLTHDALVLPAGLYTITAKAQNQEQKNGVAGTGYFLYANDEKVEITGTNTYSTTVKLDADKSELVIKFALEGCTGNWISCDNVTLTYVGEDFPAYTLVTGKMNAAVTAAQTAAAEAFEANKTVAKYNALIAAIASAQASKAAYDAAATAIANANDIKTNHNFASAEAATTFAEAIEALETKYDANTMTTDEGNGAGLALGSVVTGWHAGANSAAVAYLNNGFELNAFDKALYINTWSTEGEDDGSNFKVPFYEYFAGEGSVLGKNTWTGQVSGLENGLYSVSAWVRVRSMNGETAAADLTGISMNVNGGTSVDVTEGDIVPVQEGNARFQHKVYTAEGLVKDGVLNLNFDIAEENNIHWLSFKNIKYTKVRDLTPEEQIVYATAEDYEALAQAIEVAEAKTFGFEEGEYAPYNNIAAIAALNGAKAINPTGQNVQASVQEATATLTSVTWTANTTEVNAVYNGDFSLTDNNAAPAGWRSTKNGAFSGQYMPRVFNGDDRLAEFNETKSAFFIRFDGTNSDRGTLYYYGDADDTHIMPLKAETYYYVKADIKGWGSSGKKQRLNVTGPTGSTGFSSVYQEITLSDKADTDDATPQQFLIVFKTTVAGNYSIFLQTPGDDNQKHNAVISNIELYKAASASLAVNSDVKYGTFAAPFDVAVPEGVTAYKVEDVESDAELKLEEVTTIEANKPVLLYAENGYNATTVYGKAVAAENVKNGLLTGVYAETDAPVGSYVLQYLNDKAAFYKVADGAQLPKVGANRAYLTLPSNAAAPRAIFIDGEATGISAYDVLTSGQYDGIYTANGVQIPRLQKGVNILKKGNKTYKIYVK